MHFVNTNDVLISQKLKTFKSILDVLLYQKRENLSDARTTSYLVALGITTLVGRVFTVQAFKAIKRALTNPFIYRDSPVVKFALYLLSTGELTASEFLTLQDKKFKKRK